LRARIERTGASFKVTGAQKRTQEWLFFLNLAGFRFTTTLSSGPMLKQ